MWKWKYRHSVKENRKDIDRQPGSSRPRSVCVNENTENVEDLVLHQEYNPKTHRSICEISHETGIHRLTVHRIIHQSRSPAQVCQMTSCAAAVGSQSRCPSDSLQTAAEEVQWFCSWLHMVYGWKSVYRRTTKIKLSDWPGLCASQNQETTHRSQLLRTRLTFSRSVMVSVTVSKWISLNWYLSTMVWRWKASITVMSCSLSRCFQQSNVSQQDSAPAHRARDTIQLLQQETLDFIGLGSRPDLWPPNSPDLHPVNYKIWGVVQRRVYAV